MISSRAWAAALLVLLLGAAACGGDTVGDTETGAAGDAGTGTQTEPVAGEDLGTVTVGPGEPIRIASLQAISGPVSPLGEDQVRATEIAIDDFGGELLGHEIVLQSEDEGCSAEGGTTAAQKIVSDPQIVGAIGTSCSGAAVPASQIISEAGGVLISGSNTSPSLTATGYLVEGPLEEAENFSPGYFRTAHNDEFQGDGAAQFVAEELQLTRAATIHDGDPYTEGLTTAFGDSFATYGGEVVLPTAINKGDTDMRPVLTEIAAAEPEIIFMPIFQPEADFIVQQVGEIAGLEDVVLMGADGILADTFVTIPETEGMYFSGPARPDSTAYDEFVAKYEERFGEPPIQSFHAHAYDATMLLLTTIEQVAEEQDDGSLVIDRQALRDALYATDGFEGLTGSISCNSFGDCAPPRIGVYLNEDPSAGITGTVGNVVYTSSPEVKAEEG